MNKRSAVLMPLTSLPGDSALGVIGKEAYKFIDRLSEAKIHSWQMLPINIFDHGGCPYASPSAFGGEPLLLSLESIDRGNQHPHTVDFKELTLGKKVLLQNWALDRISDPHILKELHHFREIRFWAHDLAIFLTLRDQYGPDWTQWSRKLLNFHEAERFVEDNLRPQYMSHLILQREFYLQWQELKKYAHRRNVTLIGDIPIFISAQSFDTWRWRHLFKIDQKTGKPLVITGAPPDGFNSNGQLWGTVNYNWDSKEVLTEIIDWWIHRLTYSLDLYDMVRIDHFIGLYHVWESPADAQNASSGRWVKGKGDDFFTAIRKHFPHMPFIAEDLGELRPEIEKLRDKFGLPSMKVYQFSASEDDNNDHLPTQQKENNCYYTGTHDSNTLMGWLKKCGPTERDLINKRLELDDEQGQDLDIVQDKIIEAVANSAADLVIYPLQDIFHLDDRARINIPGTTGNNWTWRLPPHLWNESRWKNFKKILAQTKRTHP